jgi:RNA polymerase-binding transcription factor DksA
MGASRTVEQPVAPSATYKRLIAERDSIQRVIDIIERDGLDLESESDSIGEATSTQHAADVASDTFEREREFGLLEDMREQRLAAERSIARFRDGSYGRCVDCGDHIGRERLRALPAAARCIRCQERIERPERLDWSNR